MKIMTKSIPRIFFSLKRKQNKNELNSLEHPDKITLLFNTYNVISNRSHSTIVTCHIVAWLSKLYNLSGTHFESIPSSMYLIVDVFLIDCKNVVQLPLIAVITIYFDDKVNAKAKTNAKLFNSNRRNRFDQAQFNYSNSMQLDLIFIA